MGHAYAVGVRVYAFPSCQTIFELDFKKWKDVWDRLWREYRAEERYPSKPDGTDPYEFIRDLWTINDRLAFHPDGRTALGRNDGRLHRRCGPGGPTSTPSGVWTIHDGPVLALDVSTTHGVLATAGCHGEIKRWKLDGEASTPGPAGKPVTQAFLDEYDLIDSMAPEGQFRTTDGRRWYDFETIDEDELDLDAPPWAQLAKWWREREKLGE